MFGVRASHFLARISLSTEGSIWFLGICILVGVLYAWLLYSKKAPWGKKTNGVLAVLRFVLVTLLCFLLLGPMLNQVTFFYEKPVVVMAVDNSSSISSAYDSISFQGIQSSLDQLKNSLTEQGYELKIKTLQGDVGAIGAISFDQLATNLQTILKDIERTYEQQNLKGVILASDGIHNYGPSPRFINLSYPVYAIGMGDTIPLQDLSIQSIQYNKVVYEGKRFPLLVEVFNIGYVGETVTVQVKKEGKVVAQKTLSVKGDQQLNTAEFILDAEVSGIENYRVEIVGKTGESTYSNNVRNAFLEVVNSKQKILIAAKAPHPDIKAIRNIIDKNEGTETSLFIPGMTSTIPEGPFDLVIMHQLPSNRNLPVWITNLLKTTSTWFITGSGYNIRQVNAVNEVLEVSASGQTDLINPNFNEAFTLFKMDESLLERLRNYPPVTVPYGQFSYKLPVDLMLYQMVGNVPTDRPLLAIYNGDDKKSATFVGAGLWKWRLQEAALDGDTELFDGLFGKLIQYLATKENKRKFRVSTSKSQYYDNEAVGFITDIYNELFEKVFDYPIDLSITDNEGVTQEFNYVNGVNTDYEISGLKAGIYKYTATTLLNGKVETAQGTFSVEQLALEDISLTADHQLLQAVANNSGGQFFLPSEIGAIIDLFQSKDARPIARSDEKLQLALNNYWIPLLLMVLISTEWFARKYNGSY